MKLEEILKLIDAGYTKEEIAALETGTDPDQKPAGTDPVQKPKGTDPDQKPKGTDPDQKPAGTEPDQNAAILKALQDLQKSNNDLTSAIQSINRNSAEHGTNPALDADAILKEIIEGGKAK